MNLREDIQAAQLFVRFGMQRGHIVVFRGHIAHQVGQDGNPAQFLRRHIRQGEIQRQVGNTGGIHILVQEDRSVDFGNGIRRRCPLGRQVFQRQPGQLRLLFRRIRPALFFPQDTEFINYLLHLFRCPAGLNLRQALLLRLALFFRDRGGRQHNHIAMVAAVQEHLTDQLLKAAVLRHFRQRGKQAFNAQGIGGIPAVQPGREALDAVGQAPGEPAVILFAVHKFHPAEHAGQTLPVDSFIRLLPQRFIDQRTDFILLRRVAVLQDQVHIHLLGAVGPFQRDVLAQAGFQQRAGQRSIVRSGQHFRQCADRQVLQGIRIGAVNPAHTNDRLAALVILRADRIILGFFRRGDGFLQRDIGIRIDPVIVLQEGIQLGEYRVRINAAVQPDIGIGRMVEAVVVRQVIFIRQFRNMIRIAAGILAVAGIREQLPVQVIADQAVRGGIGALHFIEHDAVDRQLTVRVVQLIVPAFLAEGVRIPQGQRMQHRIHIDVHQVQEILVIPGRERIHRLVRERERVDERGQGALQQVHEGLAQRILFRSVQYGVLQDMENTGMVRRNRPEGDSEGFVDIVTLQPDDVRAVLPVGKAVQGGLQVRHGLGINQFKAVQNFSGFHRVLLSIFASAVQPLFRRFLRRISAAAYSFFSSRVSGTNGGTGIGFSFSSIATNTR